MEVEGRSTGFDIIDDSAFKAARTSGLLALLSQRDVQAYSEEDELITSVSQSFDAAEASRQNLHVFELQFKVGTGTLDFSKATPEDLRRYLTLLLDSAVTTNMFLVWNEEDRGLEAALLRGERDMPALQKSERIFTKPIAALKI